LLEASTREAQIGGEAATAAIHGIERGGMVTRHGAAVLLALAGCGGPAAHEGEALSAQRSLDRLVEATGGLALYRNLDRMAIERDLHEPRDERDAGPRLSSQTLDNHLGSGLTITEDVPNARPLVLTLPEGSVSSGAGGNEESVEDGTAEWMRGFFWRQWWYIAAEHAAGRLPEGMVTLDWSGPHEGREVVRLRIAPTWTEPYLLELDRRTWLPVRRLFAFAGGEPTVDDSFHDFQDVEGFLLPHKILSRSRGKLTEDIRIRTYLPGPRGQPKTTRERILQLLSGTMMERRIPGLSYAIVRNGELWLEGALGVASVELDVPATPQTVYPISSVSKVFAGIAVLKLVEEDRLSLDDPLGRFYRDLPGRVGEITVRQLLSHTHGLRDLHDNPDFDALPEAYRSGMSTADRLRWAAGKPPRFEPGRGWAYSQLGYEAVGDIVRRLVGLSYHAFVRERILEPSAMTASVFGGTEVVVPGRAPVLYEWVDDRLENHVVDFSPSSYPAAGLNASVGDLARLLLALETREILSDEGVRKLWQAVEHGDEGEPWYALGWSSHRTRRAGRWVVGHEGGGASWMNYYPNHRLGVVILSNLSGARADLLPYWIGDVLLAPPLKTGP
jgi:CubicO group peptidase (beta-lactamase class C family)